MWFAIKIRPRFKDGSKNLWLTIQLSRSFPDDIKAIIQPVIQRNGYFAHPENILLAMIMDERDVIKQLGLRRILKAHQQKPGIVRKFAVHKINFDAADYTDLIDWLDVSVTIPPLLSSISLDDISSRIFEGNNAPLPFLKVPCHTQAVERCVKLVTEAALSVCGETARNGFIKVRIASRMQMSSFTKKTDYVFDGKA